MRTAARVEPVSTRDELSEKVADELMEKVADEAMDEVTFDSGGWSPGQ